MSKRVGRLQPSEWLGRELVVVIDRPAGSRHPGAGFVYPVNYGYVPDTIAPDGAGLDAYVLGPSGPLERFEGRVVAVIVRRDDVEDKLVVSDRLDWSASEIESAVAFQEQFFDAVVVTDL